MIKELNHVAVRTMDIEKSIHFYKDILGGTIIRDAYSPDKKGRYVYVQISEGVIELIKWQPGAPSLGLQHVAFLLNEPINDVHEKLVEMGYKFKNPPKLGSAGDAYLAFFEDTSDVLFEIIQKEENIRIPGLKNEHIEEFDHISIRVTDESYKKCEDFYLNTLGFEVRTIMKKPGTVMSYYKKGPDTIETLYGEGKPKVDQPLGHIAMRVKDCYETKKYLESCGIECPEPKESGMGGFNILNVQGPDGEILEFVDRPSLEEYGK